MESESDSLLGRMKPSTRPAHAELISVLEMAEGKRRGTHIRSKESRCYDSRTRRRSPRPALRAPYQLTGCSVGDGN